MSITTLHAAVDTATDTAARQVAGVLASLDGYGNLNLATAESLLADLAAADEPSDDDKARARVAMAAGLRAHTLLRLAKACLRALADADDSGQLDQALIEAVAHRGLQACRCGGVRADRGLVRTGDDEHLDGGAVRGLGGRGGGARARSSRGAASPRSRTTAGWRCWEGAPARRRPPHPADREPPRGIRGHDAGALVHQTWTAFSTCSARRPFGGKLDEATHVHGGVPPTVRHDPHAAIAPKASFGYR